MRVSMDADLYKLYTTSDNRKYKEICKNKELLSGFFRAVNAMMAAKDTNELKNISYLHYEQLRYQYSGLSSVRLSNRYVHRLIFMENNDELTLQLLEIDNTHYGNK